MNMYGLLLLSTLVALSQAQLQDLDSLPSSYLPPSNLTGNITQRSKDAVQPSQAYNYPDIEARAGTSSIADSAPPQDFQRDSPASRSSVHGVGHGHAGHLGGYGIGFAGAYGGPHAGSPYGFGGVYGGIQGGYGYGGGFPYGGGHGYGFGGGYPYGGGYGGGYGISHGYGGYGYGGHGAYGNYNGFGRGYGHGYGVYSSYPRYGYRQHGYGAHGYGNRYGH